MDGILTRSCIPQKSHGWQFVLGWTSTRGFSLLEILFAFCIVAVSVLPIIGLITDRFKETPVIEGNRFAQERGYDIMVRTMDDVPFEMLKAGTNPGDCGSIRPLASPSYAPWNAAYATQLLNSIYPGSTLLCTTTVVDKKGISYLIVLEVTDIQTPNGFSKLNGTWNDPGTWRDSNTSKTQLFFDYYDLPEFYRDPQYLNAASAEKYPFTSPYRFYGAALPAVPTGLRQWGPAQRAAAGSGDFSAAVQRFPRSQKDRTRAWGSPNWEDNNQNGYYCTMKKLKLSVKWNLDVTCYSTPYVTTGRPQWLDLMAFKADIASSTEQN